MKYLKFFKGGMCAACEEQEPAVQAFERKHMGAVIVLRLNPNLKDYALPSGKRVKLTPSFGLYEDQTPVRQREGEILTLDELEHFVFDDEATAVKNDGAHA